MVPRRKADAAAASDEPSPSEWAAALAAKIGLRWPWKGPSGPGRPTHQVYYEQQLAEHLKNREFEKLEGISDTICPVWWCKGFPVGIEGQRFMKERAKKMFLHTPSSGSGPAAEEEAGEKQEE